MDLQARFLQHRLQEELVWLRAHADPQATEADAMDYLREQCGFHEWGCAYETSEYCQIDCPFKEE